MQLMSRVSCGDAVQYAHPELRMLPRVVTSSPKSSSFSELVSEDKRSFLDDCSLCLDSAVARLSNTDIPSDGCGFKSAHHSTRPLYSSDFLSENVMQPMS
jgi:hypothetical protein